MRQLPHSSSLVYVSPGMYFGLHNRSQPHICSNGYIVHPSISLETTTTWTTWTSTTTTWTWTSNQSLYIITISPTISLFSLDFVSLRGCGCGCVLVVMCITPINRIQFYRGISILISLLRTPLAQTFGMIRDSISLCLIAFQRLRGCFRRRLCAKCRASLQTG
jgi:hypothetical protein